MLRSVRTCVSGVSLCPPPPPRKLPAECVLACAGVRTVWFMFTSCKYHFYTPHETLRDLYNRPSFCYDEFREISNFHFGDEQRGSQGWRGMWGLSPMPPIREQASQHRIASPWSGEEETETLKVYLIKVLLVNRDYLSPCFPVCCAPCLELSNIPMYE